MFDTDAATKITNPCPCQELNPSAIQQQLTLLIVLSQNTTKNRFYLTLIRNFQRVQLSSRSQWLRGQMRSPAGAWLLGFRVRIPLGAWMFVSCVYMLCFPV
jgi:hypothetical protein